ncbi:MAG TPA: hypothetical protein VMM12_04405 [Longimicrobiales bacterium]|nr:hypothetical protein [Longimicrobiales bacterium]
MGVSQASLVPENVPQACGRPAVPVPPVEPRSAIRVRPEDRSHLLRRAPRSTYFDSEEEEEEDGIRLRRQRRLNSSFSEIPPLARNGRR